MLKTMKGEKVTGGTVFSTDTPETYCAMANAGYHFVWTEMQHDSRDWGAVGRMWKACPHAKVVPRVRVAYSDEREIQHAMDLGALVIVIPKVRSVEEGKAATEGTMFPPVGKRSQGVGQAFNPEMWGNVTGGVSRHHQQQRIADRDDRDAGWRGSRARSRGNSGRHRDFRRQRRSGYKQGTPDYERLINVVHDAAISAGKRLCGPFAWRDRPDFTCFRNASETAAIAPGVVAELGPLKDTQGKPEVGPYAPKK